MSVAPGADAVAAAARQVLLLPVGADLYALPLALAREVLIDVRLTRVPTAPGSVLGVLNVRGQVVPVLDTAVVLGLPGVGAPRAVVIADTARGLAGLTATAMPEASTLEDELDPSDLAAGIARHVVAGTDGPRVATLVDVGRLVEPDRIGG